jgi:anti-sigma factor RsiW
MKKPKTVLDAERAVKAARDALHAAQMEVERVREDLRAAIARLQDARADADAALPQCEAWSGNVKAKRPVVILRTTPTGMLVVRGIGEEKTFRFKWNRAMQEWLAVSGYSQARLRNVPPEFMPESEKAE